MDESETVERLIRAIDTVVLPDSDRYTLNEVAERAGTTAETARRLWRALGFADPHPDDRICGDLDVVVLVSALDQTLTHEGVDTLVRQTRMMSAAISKITELWVDQIRTALDSGDPNQVAEAEAAFVDQDRTMWMLGYMHRRLFAAGLRRELANRSTGTGAQQTAVFADLVGYTTLSERLGPMELSELIGGFEAIAYDTVASYGGRVVKTIGDEVLFSTDDPAVALDATTELISAGVAAGLPPFRAGLDHGAVVWFEGDLFGPTVNRAARLVAEAPVGGLAVAGSFRDTLPDRAWTSLGDRDLKGVGVLQVFSLDVAG